MNNTKLQVALDELERLRDTIKGFKERNIHLPDTDSDAGRALSAVRTFTSELRKLELGTLVSPEGPEVPSRLLFHWWRQFPSIR
jgi:hypothetical protein